MIEILGEEEHTLCDFVINLIKSFASPIQICAELNNVLDEETESFVMRLWRMLIYETEARASGL